MASLVPSGSQKHEPLPSLPPSPIEEDLTRAAVWSEAEDEDDENDESLVPNNDPGRSILKGKGKDLPRVVVGDVDSARTDIGNGYPPTQDDEEESRKIEENLKRWETMDRQRRKAARETASASTPTSVVGDVSRRASLLWPGRKSNRIPHGGVGTHRALNTQETDDAVPLDDIEGAPSPTPSIPASPTPSDPEERRTTIPLDNPFEDTVSGSPFNDSHRSAVMDASSLPPTPAAREEKRTPRQPVSVADRPLLQATSSFSRPPPPEPLDIPPPRTPPPSTAIPAINRPPEPVASPTVRESEPEDEPRSIPRWWTDWLCGCREGSDRDGDDQAGRTNPFE